MKRLLIGCAGLACFATPASATPITDGDARFEVISPTLVRLEWAAGRRWEDRPTLNVSSRRFPRTAFRTRVSGSDLVIRTDRMVLRYRRNSGPFTPENLSVRMRLGGRSVVVHPRFPPAPAPSGAPPSFEVSPYSVKVDEAYRAPTSGNLGGWYRALDLAGAPVSLHDGVLSRDGWYLLDDAHTVLLQDAAPGFAERPAREGPYQDGYLFAYGHDYRQGLADLRTLTGAAPLLPRQAFGVWFSRYFAYRQADYPQLLARFRAERVPLDVLMVDTDFKEPHAWNGWSWSPSLFPDPPSLVSWAHREGIAVSLNTHPSITTDDPRFAQAERRAGRTLPADPTRLRCLAMVGAGDLYGTGSVGLAPDCRVFDWARAGDQEAYFGLHAPFERDGVDFWWLDYCCDESYAVAPGLTQDTWINHLYAQRNFARGSRWPVLSRIGASVFEPDEAGVGVWADRRNAIHFTGDARPTWSMLDFQTVFTASEGSAGIPYVSHDIGGFGALASDLNAGRHLADDLYVRWVQSGTFQPILRLHSDHGDRLPWDYPGRAQEIATRFLRLRGELVPYLYTLARAAHDTGSPMTERMYLRWPEHEPAYAHAHQYMLGPGLLVAPVGSPGETATKEVWFPPGRWTDIFTGEDHRGPAVKRLDVPLARMPVFARDGAVIPRQEYRPRGNTSAPDHLILDVYPGRRGGFALYEDDGDGLAYRSGRSARTRFTQTRRGRTTTVTIGAARGSYAGRPARRSYEVRLIGTRRPRTVTIAGRRSRSWSYGGATLTVRTGALATARSAKIIVRTS